MNLLDTYPGHPHLDVVRIVSIDHEDRVLLVQEYDDINWKLPGGKVEDNETVLKAIQREVSEELGVTIDRHDIAKIIKKPIPSSSHYRYIVQVSIDVETIQKTTDVREYGYYSLKSLPPTKFQEHIQTAVNFVAKSS